MNLYIATYIKYCEFDKGVDFVTNRLVYAESEEEVLEKLNKVLPRYYEWEINEAIK